MSENKVLIVDDEKAVCKVLQVQLRDAFDVVVATSGEAALEILDSDGPFFAVVSDYQMPGMDGIELLARVRDLYPDVIRVILTASTMFDAAVDAVNRNAIFRFVTKPCSGAELLPVLEAAQDQFRLEQAEKDVLNRTLQGSVNLLVDILSITHPEAFCFTSRTAKVIREMCDVTNSEQSWEIRMAALLCRLGFLSLDQDLATKLANGLQLTAAEEEILNGHPEIGGRLVGRIPRLEGVAEIISNQLMDHSDAPQFSEERWFEGVSMLQVASDFVKLSEEVSEPNALATMWEQQERYHPECLAALVESRQGKHSMEAVAIDVYQLREGMVLAENLLDRSNRLLIPKGREISQFLLERVKTYAGSSTGVMEPLYVFAPAKDEDEIKDEGEIRDEGGVDANHFVVTQ